MFTFGSHPFRLPLAGLLRIRTARHAGLAFLFLPLAPLAFAFFAQSLGLEFVPVTFDVLQSVALLDYIRGGTQTRE